MENMGFAGVHQGEPSVEILVEIATGLSTPPPIRPRHGLPNALGVNTKVFIINMIWK